jgi:hypothetical protein
MERPKFKHELSTVVKHEVVAVGNRKWRVARHMAHEAIAVTASTYGRSPTYGRSRLPHVYLLTRDTI